MKIVFCVEVMGVEVKIGILNHGIQPSEIILDILPLYKFLEMLL